ncbi:hypothetical protein [Silvanigrella aquatica]|uniref:Uncharacterized protein n=1 Tax=Silvanigrella aquatica TaxID=1915309 RepID=A0A1L4D1D4_9BACT|nr:hypothetical protein [Silvanigrella aquatica]APJ04007.1 hypothetical protein AXG55_08845 [Silvanigrella aquatica]
MKKNRAIYVASIASTLAMVGCGFKGNTNMQDYSTDIGTKWDALANQIGTHTVAEAPDVLSNRGQITENLKQAPTNFNPTKGGDKYKENKKFAVDYVNKNITKSQATEIVSIRKLSDLLGEELTKENANVTAVPYIERASFAKINDLSGIKTLSGINHNSEFQIAGTLNGKISNKNKAEGTAYVITYKLDNSAHNYTAIVTIPKNNKNEKLPLMMYAHGGDAGLSFSNMATVMQNNLRRAIVAAPAFPGEPICSITTQGGSEKNSFKRSCVNYNGDVQLKVAQKKIVSKDRVSITMEM